MINTLNTYPLTLHFALQNEGKFNFDTRIIKNGDVFIALNTKEQKIDGHNFVNNAIEKGAAFCIVAKDFKNFDDKIASKLVYCQTNDVLDCITKIASQKIEFLKSKGVKIISVTGSVGKTTTKNLIKFICDKAFNQDFCYATTANYNNFIGVPYTILQGGSNAKILTIEIGMDKAGEINHLASILKPDVAIITEVSGVHLANFKCVQDIAFTKGECIQHSKICLTNKTINFASVFKGLCLRHKKLHKNPSWNIIKYKVSGFQTSFKLKNKFLNTDNVSNSILINKPLTSQYLQNIALALDAINLCQYNLSIEDINKIYLQDFYSSQSLPGRGNWINTSIKTLQNCSSSHNITIIDESYNASPISVKNSLRNLALIARRKCSLKAILKPSINFDKKTAIMLGDMMELGSDEIAIHKSLIPFIIKTNPSLLIFVGSRMKFVFDTINKNIANNSIFSKILLPKKLDKNCKLYYFENYEAVIKSIENIKGIIITEKINFVLIKSSHSIKLDKVVEMLII